MQVLEYELWLGARVRTASGSDRLHSTYRELSEGAVIRSLPLAVLTHKARPKSVLWHPVSFRLISFLVLSDRTISVDFGIWFFQQSRGAVGHAGRLNDLGGVRTRGP